MMTDKQQIEELRKFISQLCCNSNCDNCKWRSVEEGSCLDYFEAEALYNAGYRKIDANAVVLTRGEYYEMLADVKTVKEKLVRMFDRTKVETRKATAKEILQWLSCIIGDKSFLLYEIMPYIESKYELGVSCKQIKGYENYYVTNNGIVINFQTREIKKQFLDRKGYSVVTLYKDNKPKNIRVHRLVALAFIDNPNNKPEVNHKNGVKTDNRVENLEWTTTRENSTHRTIVLGKGNIKPVRCVETGLIYPSGLSAAKLCNTSSGAISKSCYDVERKATAGGYHWEHLTDELVEVEE